MNVHFLAMRVKTNAAHFPARHIYLTKIERRRHTVRVLGVLDPNKVAICFLDVLENKAVYCTLVTRSDLNSRTLSRRLAEAFCFIFSSH